MIRPAGFSVSVQGNIGCRAYLGTDSATVAISIYSEFFALFHPVGGKQAVNQP